MRAPKDALRRSKPLYFLTTATRRLLWSVGAILFAAVISPRTALACDFDKAPSSRWALAAENGVDWLKTPCGDRFYSIGVNIGSGMKANSLDLNTEALMAGLQDGISGTKPQLSDKDRQETLMAFEQDLQKKETERLKQVAEKNKKEGAEFLATNKAKEGVKTLPSGFLLRT